MKFLKLKRLIIRQGSDKNINIQVVPISINPLAVCAISPMAIPSEMNGPDGNPITKIGSVIMLTSDSVIVDIDPDALESAMKEVCENGDLEFGSDSNSKTDSEVVQFPKFNIPSKDGK